MQLFYHEILTDETRELHFGKEESRHIAKVLRKEPGDILMVTNGCGLMAQVALDRIDPKRCVGRPVKIEMRSPLSYRLHLAVAPTKSNDRFEWFIEKATEIGISEITPIISTRSERKTLKIERSRRVAIAAMKQSGRAWLPEINELTSLDQFLQAENDKDHTKAIAHCMEGSRKTLKGLLSQGADCCVLIGPEGDFTDQELEAAIDAGFVGITLGTSRLRTETAAIVACHSVAVLNEDNMI